MPIARPALWEGAWQSLSATFTTLITRMVDVYPALVGQQPRQLEGLGATRFHHHVAFSYNFAHCEWIDLQLSVSCAPSAYFLHDDGSPWFPRTTIQDAIGAEIERGNGQRLAACDPVLLPEDESSPEYEAQVMDYVSRTQGFIEDSMPLMIEALREPFSP